MAPFNAQDFYNWLMQQASAGGTYQRPEQAQWAQWAQRYLGTSPDAAQQLAADWYGYGGQRSASTLANLVTQDMAYPAPAPPASPAAVTSVPFNPIYAGGPGQPFGFVGPTAPPVTSVPFNPIYAGGPGQPFGFVGPTAPPVTQPPVKTVPAAPGSTPPSGLIPPPPAGPPVPVPPPPAPPIGPVPGQRIDPNDPRAIYDYLMARAGGTGSAYQRPEQATWADWLAGATGFARDKAAKWANDWYNNWDQDRGPLGWLKFWGTERNPASVYNTPPQPGPAFGYEPSVPPGAAGGPTPPPWHPEPVAPAGPEPPAAAKFKYTSPTGYQGADYDKMVDEAKAYAETPAYRQFSAANPNVSGYRYTGAFTTPGPGFQLQGTQDNPFLLKYDQNLPGVQPPNQMDYWSWTRADPINRGQYQALFAAQTPGLGSVDTKSQLYDQEFARGLPEKGGNPITGWGRPYYGFSGI